MELNCLPSATPTTASSCSTDPLYDNCPLFAQQGRGKEVESRVVCAAVTRLPGSCSPLTALAPAEVPTAVREGRGAGPGPDHSYCSWKEGLGKRGPQGGERGHGSRWGVEDHNESPAVSQSAEHRSALSVYDNLPDAATPDSLRELADMERSFQGTLQEQMYRAWLPDQLQGLMDEEGVSDYNSIWSSCEIILNDQDKGHQEEGQLDWVQLSPHHQQTAANAPRGSPADDQTAWPSAEVRHPEQPRVPPPVPLADPSASALRSLLTSLQQQIVKQREEYEARILRYHFYFVYVSQMTERRQNPVKFTAQYD